MTASAISYLFVPASRPDRYGKALATDAHAVIIDLEDAVARDDKASSLDHLLAALEAGLARPTHVRINAADSEWFERDLEALAGLSAAAWHGLAGVIVPKAESAAEVARVAAVLGEGPAESGGTVELIATIESAAGVAAIRDIAGVSGLTRFAVGAADLSFDLDVEIVSSTIDWVYAQLVIESRLAGLVGPVASPPFEISDTDVVEREAIRLRGLGATAQLCIHPAQIAPIHAGFLPNPEALAWAQRVVAASADGDGAVQVDGQMVDKPVLERAQRIVAQAARA